MEGIHGCRVLRRFAAPTLTARMMFRLYSSALWVRERDAMLAHESFEIAHHNVKCKASNSTYLPSYRAPKTFLRHRSYFVKTSAYESSKRGASQLMVEPFHHLVIRSEGFCTLVDEEWSCAHRHREYLEQTSANDEAGRNIHR